MRDFLFNCVMSFADFMLHKFPLVLSLGITIFLFIKFPIATLSFHLVLLIFSLFIERKYLNHSKQFHSTSCLVPENVYLRILWKTFLPFGILLYAYLPAFKHTMTLKVYVSNLKNFYLNKF